MRIFRLQDCDIEVDPIPGCDVVIFPLDQTEVEVSDPNCFDVTFFSEPCCDFEIFIPGPPGPKGEPGPVGLAVKSGFVLGVNLTGSPRKFLVVFDDPFLDTNYSISLCGTDSRSYTYENKTVNGFDINSNASTAIDGEVSWVATAVGET